MDERCDIAIVGAGAAGLAAAIFAADTTAQQTRPARIVVLDGAARIGAKILISGGGRCNVTHDVVEARDFNGTQHVVRHVLAAFDERSVVSWFGSLGVRLKREPTGKLFPVSDSAREVLDALMCRCETLRVRVRTASRVDRIQRVQAADGSGPAGFELVSGSNRIQTRRVVLATGGRSLPRTGSDGAGLDFAVTFGHTVGPTVPALVPLVLDGSFFHERLSGLSVESVLDVRSGGKTIARHRGSLLWTHFGASGPVVLDASRHWTLAQESGSAVELRASFLPDWNAESFTKSLLRMAQDSPRRRVQTALGDLIPVRLAAELMRWSNIEGETALGQIARNARDRLVQALTGLLLPVAHDRGWNYAEVTAGGVPLHEIDFRTMQSRRTPGLYLAGELLDCDGRIGGFNFQWAWSTGHLAGRAAAASLPG